MLVINVVENLEVQELACNFICILKLNAMWMIDRMSLLYLLKKKKKKVPRPSNAISSLTNA